MVYGVNLQMSQVILDFPRFIDNARLIRTNKRGKMRKFVLYCFCGGCGIVTDFTVYYLCISDGIWYQTANVFGYIAAGFVSFSLNAVITFDIKDRIFRRLVTFFGVASIGYLVSVLLLWFLVLIMYLDPIMAKLITLPIILVLQFTLNRKLTFHKSSIALSNQS